MTKRSLLMVLIGIAIALLPLTMSARRLTAAEERLDAARTALADTTRDAEEILRLRGQRQHIAHAAHPTQDVIARINATLSDAGLPRSAFKDLTPEASQALDRSAEGELADYRKQSLRLSLHGLTPTELGRFLAQWRQTQPLWSVTRIDLAHERRGDARSERYDATLLLTALYVAND